MDAATPAWLVDRVRDDESTQNALEETLMLRMGVPALGGAVAVVNGRGVRGYDGGRRRRGGAHWFERHPSQSH